MKRNVYRAATGGHDWCHNPRCKCKITNLTLSYIHPSLWIVRSLFFEECTYVIICRCGSASVVIKANRPQRILSQQPNFATISFAPKLRRESKCK